MLCPRLSPRVFSNESRGLSVVHASKDSQKFCRLVDSKCVKIAFAFSEKLKIQCVISSYR